MASFTTRMGLTKPAGNEDRAVGPLNTNSDLLDKFMPCILVNDGVTPPTGDLYDGALVKERTSGIIWEARKNGGGTYDKVYVRYPLIYSGKTTAQSVANGSAYVAAGVASTTSAECKNTSAANITGGKFVVPVKGIYRIGVSQNWANNTTGSRALSVEINSVTQTGSIQNIQTAASTAFGPSLSLSYERLLNLSDVVCGSCWQTSGGALNVDTALTFSLLEPVQ